MRIAFTTFWISIKQLFETVCIMTVKNNMLHAFLIKEAIVLISSLVRERVVSEPVLYLP